MRQRFARRVVLATALVVAGASAITWAVVRGDALAPVVIAAAGGLTLGLGVALLLLGVAPPARAEADSLPALVAHRMSSPLSALKTNLEWLRDALEAGRLREPGDEAEAREVLRDAREATEALRADVGELRAAGRAPGPPSPGEAGPGRGKGHDGSPRR
jgi:hypothetical protein